MKTTIKKTFTVNEPIEKVWAYLSTPTKIASCVPGATITEEIDDKNFKGEVTMKFGPIKAKYDGHISIERLDTENHEMVLNGKGLDSKGKGSAEMLMNGQLTSKDQNTDVSFQMDVTVIGMLAQFGSRLVDDVSSQLFDKFVDNFKQKLAGEEVDNSIQAGSMIGSIVKQKIGGLFSGPEKKRDA